MWLNQQLGIYLDEFDRQRLGSQAEALSIPGGGFNNIENRAGDTFSKGKSCVFYQFVKKFQGYTKQFEEIGMYIC